MGNNIDIYFVNIERYIGIHIFNNIFHIMYIILTYLIVFCITYLK